MVLRKSIGSQVPWPELAAVLGVTLMSRALPAQVECPLCGGRLHVYEDNIKGGAWHHCFDCQSQGDLIELAMDAWELPLDACLEKLFRLGLLPGEVSPERVKQQVGRMARDADFQKFWQACQLRLQRHRSGETNALRTRFRLSWRGDPDRWAAGPGVLLGSARAKVVERLFTPQPSEQNISQHNRTFRGRGWGETLVIAYHDVPERVAGFFFVGRTGTRKDMVWRRVPRRRTRSSIKLITDEFGLAGLPLVVGQAGPVLCVNDPLLVLRLQVRQAALADRPLSLVAWHEGLQANTRNAWRVLAGRRLVFWGWRLTSRLVRQAVATGGELCLLGPTEPEDRASVDHYLDQDTPEDLYRRAIRHAKPWQEVLSDRICEGTDGWCEGLFLQLQRDGGDVDAILRELRPKARRLVGDVLHLPPAERTVLLGNYRFSEKNLKWEGIQVMNTNTHNRDPMRITNFVVRIYEVVLKDGEPYYKGIVICNRDSARFELPQTSLDKGGTEQLRRVFYRAGHQTHLWVRAERWSRLIVPLALAFGPPTVIREEEPQNGGPAAPESPETAIEPPEGPNAS